MLNLSAKQGDKSFIIKYFLLAIWGIVTIYPLFFTLISSFKTQNDLFSNLFGMPKHFILHNYIKLFVDMHIEKNILNSLIISISACFFQVIFSLMAAFILARFDFKWNNKILIFFMAGLMVPIQSVLIPIATIAKQINGYNNYIFIIIVYITFGLSYLIFILTGFMKSVPKEIEEAGIIDGASAGKVFTKIMVPLSLPAIASVSILSFFGSWNELMFSLILMKRIPVRTISVALVNFSGDRFSDYTGQCAAVILAILPTIIVYFLLQENIIKGMTAGAVKG
jgi:raffinose/stachyose/melibiose transport system permease protein